MKKLLLLILCFSNAVCFAQEGNTDSGQFSIENDQKLITNEMIFWQPFWFKKNKKPLYLINGKEVYTLAEYYDHSDFKKITVLQPKEGLAKFGSKGKNGVIMLELNDDVKEPEIEITTNRIYYLCNINKKITDTTLEYYNKVKANECNVLDLREPVNEHLLYIGFDNKMHMKHLGIGWDVITISIAGATVSGTGPDRLIRVSKEGTVRFVINANGKEKVFMMKAVPLPAAK